MKTGVNTSIIIDLNKERKKKDIKPLKSNCNTCLYFDGKSCKFNKSIQGRKYCIKYQYSSPGLIPKQKKAKQTNGNKVGAPTKEIRKTTFNKLSELIGVTIKLESLSLKYRSYSKGYSIKIYSTDPLIIAIRHNITKKKFYFEIIE